MKQKSLILAVAASAALTGCVEKQTLNMSQSFDRNEVSWYENAKGTADITGSALIRQQGGGVVTCAGNQVNLIPKSLYAIERMNFLYGNTVKGYLNANQIQWKEIATTDDAYLKLSKQVLCDAQGYFKFKDVPKGDYFLTTAIVWQVNTYFKEGGYLMATVSVDDADVDVVLTP
jgi:hypothetical protein